MALLELFGHPSVHALRLMPVLFDALFARVSVVIFVAFLRRRVHTFPQFPSRRVEKNLQKTPVSKRMIRRESKQDFRPAG